MNEIADTVPKLNSLQTFVIGAVIITAIIVLGTGSFAMTEEIFQDSTIKRTITYSHNK